MLDHLLDCVLDTRTRLLRQLPRISARLAVDLRGAGAQHAGGAVQGAVDRAEVGQRMGLCTCGALGAQYFTQALRRAVPARGNADPTVPEARTGQIVARAAHGNSWRR